MVDHCSTDATPASEAGASMLPSKNMAEEMTAQTAEKERYRNGTAEKQEVDKSVNGTLNSAQDAEKKEDIEKIREGTVEPSGAARTGDNLFREPDRTPLIISDNGVETGGANESSLNGLGSPIELVESSELNTAANANDHGGNSLHTASNSLSLGNYNLISSSPDNTLSIRVVKPATNDGTANFLHSTQVTGLPVSPENPNVAPSSFTNVPDEHDEAEKKPETPLKDRQASTASVESPPPPPPPPKDVPPKDRIYLDPAPVTPAASRPGSPAASPVIEDAPNKHMRSRSENSSDDDDVGEETRTQIHNIFEQSKTGPVADEQHERATSSPSATSPAVPSPTVQASINASIHPPRSSSLSESSNPKRPLSLPTQNPAVAAAHAANKIPFTPVRTTPALTVVPATPKNASKPPPPDEDLPFDFHRFLSQLRHRSADPVAKFLRSFLNEFAKKQWMVHEQIKIIHDFLNFIYGKMEGCEVWREVGDVEMDNAREGMEKLVMNRLYTQTFSPAIPPPLSTPNRRNARDRDREERFPGRRGQHQEDVERDEILAQKVRIYGWVREEHLDIADTVVAEGGRRFLDLAVGELLKMGTYRAPRDKVICVLNCCKVIFGLLRHSKSDESADKFVPLLIYVVLRANPEHLVSNVNYIMRFRNPEKLGGEAGYYLSSLSGAISFIENLDRSSLTITNEEFEKNVVDAVAAIAERPPPPTPPPVVTDNYDGESISEKSRQGPATTPGASADQRDARPRTNSDNSGPTNGESDEKQAVAGLLRSIQKPLSTIGRIFGDDPGAHSGPSSGPAITPRHSPSTEDTLLTAVGGRRHPRDRERVAGTGRPEGSKLSAEESAARQASAEAEEARRIQIMEHEKVVEVLKAMFPALDKDVIGDVVRLKEGSVGLAVDACLVLNSGM